MDMTTLGSIVGFMEGDSVVGLSVGDALSNSVGEIVGDVDGKAVGESFGD